MVFSVGWLREWLFLEKSINYISEQLTMFGLHVESIEPIPYYINNPIIAHIINYKDQPKNRYYVYSVDVGYKRLLAIKSPNYLDQYVCVNIAASSFLWGLSDININYKPDILIKLPLETKLGSELGSYYKHNGNIIKISIAPNKTHCSSMFGVVRELSCLYNMLLRYPTTNYVKAAFVNSIPTLAVHNRVCPCFVTRIIRNVNTNIDTPLWLREKLIRCGIVLDNALSDIVSYVLLELGQPVHMFDLNTIKEKLSIRLSKPNEAVALFNGNIIALNSNTLVISDGHNILSLADISNTIHGSISIETDSIILSALYVSPSFIIGKPLYRICSKLLDLYERGVGYSILILAIERISDLIMTICGGFASVLDRHIVAKDIIKKARVGLHRYRLNSLIGFLIPGGKVNAILTNLNYKAIRVNADWKVLMPSWCFNIAFEEDLIEEVLSSYGLCNVNKRSIYGNLALTETNKPIKRRMSLLCIKEILIARGYHEIITYSFIEPNIQTIVFSNVKHIYIKNPISKELSVVRSSLLDGLFKALTYKLTHHQKRIRLFESGFCFVPDNSITINQKLMIAGIATGSNLEEHWDSSYRLVDSYDIKGTLEDLFAITNKANDVSLKPIHSLVLHPSQSVAIFIKRNYIGLFGSIHPKLQVDLNIYSNTFIFELYCEHILEYKVANVSKSPYLPINHRHLSIIVSKHIMASSIIDTLTNMHDSFLVGISVSDVYYDNIKEDYKSLALSFNIQPNVESSKEYGISLSIKRYATTLKLLFSVYLRY